MRKNAPSSKRPCERRPAGGSGATQPAKEAPPLELSPVEEAALSAMRPGDILLLDQAIKARECIEADFLAVLACPFCGTLVLITPAQYSGTASVMCNSLECSGLWRIVDEHLLVYPPVN